MKDYYQVLNINSSSDGEEIKKAYRKLALQFHPDRNKTSDAHENFIKINQAYEVLINEKSRKEYDQFVFSQKRNDEHVFKEKFTNEKVKQTAQQYSSMKYEDFENVVDEVTNVGKKIKKSAEVGCGFFVMSGSGILAIFSIINIGNIGYPSIILFLLFGVFTFVGWGLMQSD